MYRGTCWFALGGPPCALACERWGSGLWGAQPWRWHVHGLVDHRNCFGKNWKRPRPTHTPSKAKGLAAQIQRSPFAREIGFPSEEDGNKAHRPIALYFKVHHQPRWLKSPACVKIIYKWRNVPAAQSRAATANRSPWDLVVTECVDVATVMAAGSDPVVPAAATALMRDALGSVTSERLRASRDALSPSEVVGLLSHLSHAVYAPKLRDDPTALRLLLRALWPCPSAHPHILPAVACCAARISSTSGKGAHADLGADELLTEAEALLADATCAPSRVPDNSPNGHACVTPSQQTDARVKNSLLRLKRISAGATALMTMWSNGDAARVPADLIGGYLLATDACRFVPRLVLACARCAQAVDLSGSRRMASGIRSAAVAMLQKDIGQLTKAQTRFCARQTAAAFLAVLEDLSNCESSFVRADSREHAQLSDAEVETTRKCVSLFAEEISAREEDSTQYILEVLKAVIVLAGGKPCSGAEWASTALHLIATGPTALVPDMFALLEWQVGENERLGERFLDALAACLGLHSSIATSKRRLRERDLLLIVSILRAADASDLRLRALSMFVHVMRDPCCYLDAGGCAGSSSAGTSQSAILNHAIQSMLLLPGAGLRSETVVRLARNLVSSGDETLHECGACMLTAAFRLDPNARQPVLDAIFGVLVDTESGTSARSSSARSLERLARHPAAQAAFRDQVPRLKHWLSFLTTLPGAIASALAEAFEPIAVAVPLFRDHYMLTLRKLAATRSTQARSVACSGLIALVLDPKLEASVAREVAELVAAVMTNASMHIRADLLSALASRLLSCERNVLRDERLEPLHAAVFLRIAKLLPANRESNARCLQASAALKDSSLTTRPDQPYRTVTSGKLWPIRIENCVEVAGSVPTVKECVPELLMYISACRHTGPEGEKFLLSIVDYVATPHGGIRDAGLSCSSASLTARWCFLKFRLLGFLCELMLNQDLGPRLFDVLQTYAVTLVALHQLGAQLRLPALPPGDMADPSTYLTSLVAGPGSATQRGRHQMSAREATSISRVPARSSRGMSMTDQMYDDLRPRTHRWPSTGGVLMSVDRICSVIERLEDASGGNFVYDTVVSHLVRALAQRVPNEELGELRLSAVHIQEIDRLAATCISRTHPWRTRTAQELGRSRGQEDESRASAEISKLSTCDGADSHGSSSGSGIQDHSTLVSDSENMDSSSAGAREDPGVAPDEGRACGRSYAMRTISSFIEDQEMRSLFEEAYSTASWQDRCRVETRCGALSLLTRRKWTGWCDTPWMSIVWRESGEMLRERTTPSTPEGRLGVPILAFFEQEFAHSMTVPLCIAYVDVLRKVAAKSAGGERTAAGSDGLLEPIQACLLRILGSYSITHVRVLRAILSLLLFVSEPKSAIQFVSFMVEDLRDQANDESDQDVNSGRQADSGAFEGDGQAIYANDEFEADVVQHGYSTRATTRSRERATRITEDGEAGSQDSATNLHSEPRQCMPSISSSFPSRDCVLALSIADTQACREVSMLVGLAYIGSLWEKPAGHERGITGSCLSRRIELAELASCSYDLMDNLLLRRALSEKDAALSTEPLTPLPEKALARVRSIIRNTLSRSCELGRQARAGLVEMKSTRAGSMGLRTITIVLQRFTQLERACKKGVAQEVFGGKTRYLAEQLQLSILTLLRSLRANGLESAEATGLEDAARTTFLESNSVLDRAREPEVDDSDISIRPRRSKRRRVRSRNRVVDEWLEDEEGNDDNFADMEEFIVGLDCNEL